MIKSKLAVVGALFLILLTLNSCSNDENEAEPILDGIIQAKVDGNAWRSVNASATIHGDGLFIMGTADDQSSLRITLKAKAVGTYTILGSVNGAQPETEILYFPADFSQSNGFYSSFSYGNQNIGTLTVQQVDEVNKTVSGTFTCKLKRFQPTELEIEISGSFNRVPYTEDLTRVGANHFFAKVDGSPFWPSSISSHNSSGSILINASSGGNEIALSILDDTPTGTFPFGLLGTSYHAIYSHSGNLSQSVDGSVTITVHEARRLEGTFEFTAELYPSGGSPRSVTEGSFAIRF